MPLSEIYIEQFDILENLNSKLDYFASYTNRTDILENLNSKLDYFASYINRTEILENLNSKLDYFASYTNRTEILENLNTKFHIFSSYINRADYFNQGVNSKLDIIENIKERGFVNIINSKFDIFEIINEFDSNQIIYAFKKEIVFIEDFEYFLKKIALFQENFDDFFVKLSLFKEDFELFNDKFKFQFDKISRIELDKIKIKERAKDIYKISTDRFEIDNIFDFGIRDLDYLQGQKQNSFFEIPPFIIKKRLNKNIIFLTGGLYNFRETFNFQISNDNLLIINEAFNIAVIFINNILYGIFQNSDFPIQIDFHQGDIIRIFIS
ncbi:MAG: hypothetical protein ABIL45_03795 [candidate division WOR-3 bacterium]